jgi:hypothetical protein
VEDMNKRADFRSYSPQNTEEFQQVITGATAEVIEVKTRLGRNVIGQAIMRVDILELAFKPLQTNPVILCGYGDPLLEMICKKRGVYVWKSET